MSDRTGDEDKFMNNVVNELSAFQTTGPEAESNKASQNTEGYSRTDQHKEKMDQSNTNCPDEHNQSEPTKQPSRVIRLTRPTNPYTTSSSSEGNSSSTGSTTVSNTAPPGSRLAALQRPGSPMHKFLQRAQSPALAAAAARMNRQSAGDTISNTDNANNQNIGPSGASNTNSDSSGNTSNDTGREARFSRLRSDTDNGEERPAHNTGGVDSVKEPRVAVPPRISSKSLTGSILLRRPASPSGRQPTLSRLSTSQSLDSSGPRSPPTDSSTNQGTIHEDSQTRAAIRNKLRANSFKLKDLLTKKPFTKSADDDNGEGPDNITDESKSNNEEENKTGSGSRLLRTMGDCPDRTRWRRDGISALSRSKSTVSDRTNISLISARYRQSKLLSSSEQSQEVPEATQPQVDNGAEVSAEASKPAENRADDHSNTFNPGTKLGSPSKVTVGATLLRSPRTRNNSGNSNVPLSMSEIYADSENKSDQQIDRTVELQPKPSPNIQRKAKALSDLEKDVEANLVFDSQMIGQNEVFESNKEVESESSHEVTKQYARSQSEQYHSNQGEDTSGRQKISSEPCTPHKDQQIVRSSKSYDSTSEGDFSRSSPAIKRCLAVTDLDQAMRDRDQETLSSLFKDNKPGVETDKVMQQSVGETKRQGEWCLL